MYINHPQVSSYPVGIGGLGLMVTGSVVCISLLSSVKKPVTDSRVLFVGCERLMLAMGPGRTG